jgi:hypothetical protein
VKAHARVSSKTTNNLTRYVFIVSSFPRLSYGSIRQKTEKLQERILQAQGLVEEK